MSRYQLKVKMYGKGVPGELIDRALEECYEGDEQAVSYTHLDVYKRQDVHVQNVPAQMSGFPQTETCPLPS